MSCALLSEHTYGGMILACEEGRQLLSLKASSLTSLFLWSTFQNLLSKYKDITGEPALFLHPFNAGNNNALSVLPRK